MTIVAIVTVLYTNYMKLVNGKQKTAIASLVIGMALAALSSLLAIEVKSMVYNNCSESDPDSVCALWVSSEVDVINRGFPFAMYTSSDDPKYAENGYNFVGMLANWAIYSALVSFFIIMINYQTHRRTNG